MFAWIATRTGVQLPSPPAFARNVAESEGCLAEALAKADARSMAIDLLRATARQATSKKCRALLTFMFYKARAIQSTSILVAQTIFVID